MYFQRSQAGRGRAKVSIPGQRRHGFLHLIYSLATWRLRLPPRRETLRKWAGEYI